MPELMRALDFKKFKFQETKFQEFEFQETKVQVFSFSPGLLL